jgi:hypothetical protein
MRGLHFEVLSEHRWESYDLALELVFTVTKLADDLAILEIDDALDVVNGEWLRLVLCRDVKSAVGMAHEFRQIYARNS